MEAPQSRGELGINNDDHERSMERKDKVIESDRWLAPVRMPCGILTTDERGKQECGGVDRIG